MEMNLRFFGDIGVEIVEGFKLVLKKDWYIIC